MNMWDKALRPPPNPEGAQVALEQVVEYLRILVEEGGRTEPPKIVFCGSRRFKEEIHRAAGILRSMGYIVFEPLLNTDKRINEIPSNLGRLAFEGLTRHHFSLIQKADVCVIYNKEGYTGLSTAMELGYAVACGLYVCALEEDKDGCVNSLFDLRFESVLTLGDYLKRY